MRFQFSLRALFLIMTLVAVAASVYAYRAHLQQQRLDTMSAIECIGGHVGFRRIDSSLPYPVDERVRREALVRCVYLASTDFDADILARLKSLNEARMLSFNSTKFTDQHVTFLDAFGDLRELQLNGTDVTDRGVEYLSQRHDLEVLTLNDTNITDLTLVHLAKTETLKKLHIHNTSVSDAAVKTLRCELPSCDIEFTPKER